MKEMSEPVMVRVRCLRKPQVKITPELAGRNDSKPARRYEEAYDSMWQYRVV